MNAVRKRKNRGILINLLMVVAGVIATLFISDIYSSGKECIETPFKNQKKIESLEIQSNRYASFVEKQDILNEKIVRFLDAWEIIKELNNNEITEIKKRLTRMEDKNLLTRNN